MFQALQLNVAWPQLQKHSRFMSRLKGSYYIRIEIFGDYVISGKKETQSKVLQS